MIHQPHAFLKIFFQNLIIRNVHPAYDEPQTSGTFYTDYKALAMMSKISCSKNRGQCYKSNRVKRITIAS